MAVDTVASAAAPQVRAKPPVAPVEDDRRAREAPPEPRPKPAPRADGLGSRVDARA